MDERQEADVRHPWKVAVVLACGLVFGVGASASPTEQGGETAPPVTVVAHRGLVAGAVGSLVTSPSTAPPLDVSRFPADALEGFVRSSIGEL
jgi:hypothetical protein